MNPLFDPQARKIMQLATVEAQRLNSEMIGTGHILLALIADCNRLSGDGLIQFDSDLESVRHEVGNLCESAAFTVVGKVPLNLSAKRAVEHALMLSKNGTVSPMHLLIGILQDDDAVAVRVFTLFGLSSVDILSDAHAAIAT